MAFRGHFKIILFYGFLAVLLFLFLEISARCIFFFIPFRSQLPAGDYISDVIWRQDWVTRHKADRGTLGPCFDYAQHDPLYGWKVKPGLKNLSAFKNKVINTNAHGVRGKREFSYDRVPGKKRIILFGDSFTFGTEVSDDETYAAYLQELMPDVEVINLGVFGYGLDQMLLYLREEGIKYHPDIVMLGYLPVDKGRALLSFRDFAKPQFVLDNGKIVLRQVPVPTPQQVLGYDLWRSRFLDMLALLKRMIDVKTGRYFKDEEKVNQLLLEDFVRTARSVGAVPVFAYLEGMRGEGKPFQITAADIDFFKRWKAEKVPCLFLYPYRVKADQELLRQMGKTEFIFKREYGHFSPRENKIVADGIYDQLKGAGFI